MSLPLGLGALVVVGVGALVVLSDDDEGGGESATSEAPVTSLAPAQANVHDWIAVGPDGHFMGTASCAEGGAPYRATEVLDPGATCTNTENDTALSGDFTLCLEVNLVENYCYMIPELGYISPALAPRGAGQLLRGRHRARCHRRRGLHPGVRVEPLLHLRLAPDGGLRDGVLTVLILPS